MSKLWNKDKAKVWDADEMFSIINQRRKLAASEQTTLAMLDKKAHEYCLEIFDKHGESGLRLVDIAIILEARAHSALHVSYAEDGAMWDALQIIVSRYMISTGKGDIHGEG